MHVLGWPIIGFSSMWTPTCLSLANDLAKGGGDGGGREADLGVIETPIDVPNQHVDPAVVTLCIYESVEAAWVSIGVRLVSQRVGRG